MSRRPPGVRTFQPRGLAKTTDRNLEIYRKLLAGVSRHVLATEYNLSLGTIESIRAKTREALEDERALALLRTGGGG
jgi:DNA-binding NarL/FixJ family response regulator